MFFLEKTLSFLKIDKGGNYAYHLLLSLKNVFFTLIARFFLGKKSENFLFKVWKKL